VSVGNERGKGKGVLSGEGRRKFRGKRGGKARAKSQNVKETTEPAFLEMIIRLFLGLIF
jgi:hypothetical protein